MASDEKINESESEDKDRKKSNSESRSKLDHIESEKISSDDNTTPLKPLKPKPAIIGRIRLEETFEFPAKDDDKPVIQPWDIDTAGRSLADKRKDRPKTQYESWLDDKRKEEGEEVLCPACGAVNYDLLLVSGEKCTNCGFNYDSVDDLTRKLGADTPRAMRYPIEKQQYYDELEMVGRLALPEELISNPDRNFQYKFRTYSHLLQLALIPCFLVGIWIIYMNMESNPGMNERLPDLELLIWYYGTMLILLILTVSCLLNFLKIVRITAITVDHGGAVFHSTTAQRRLNYSQIICIDNQKRANGWTIVDSIISGNGSPVKISSTRETRTSMIGFVPDVDNASTSRSVTNHMRISTASQNVSFTFTGGENGQFIRALAIIIFMTKKKNPSCNISVSAIKAAEKGYEDYSKWLKRK